MIERTRLLTHGKSPARPPKAQMAGISATPIPHDVAEMPAKYQNHCTRRQNAVALPACVQFSIVKGTRTMRKTTLDLVSTVLSKIEARREAKRRWNEKNKEKKNEYARRWRAENKRKQEKPDADAIRRRKSSARHTTVPTTKQIGTRSVQG